jgi:trk system potassium uptake protein TrkA
LVEEAVSVGDVVRLFSLRRGEANLVELTLPDTASCVGKTLDEVTLPDDVSLAAIVRDGHVITPQPHMALASGDELLFVATSEAEDALRECLLGA